MRIGRIPPEGFVIGNPAEFPMTEQRAACGSLRAERGRESDIFFTRAVRIPRRVFVIGNPTEFPMTKKRHNQRNTGYAVFLLGIKNLFVRTAFGDPF